MAETFKGLRREAEPVAAVPEGLQGSPLPPCDSTDPLWRVADVRRRTRSAMFSSGESSQARGMPERMLQEMGRVDEEPDRWAAPMGRLFSERSDDSKPLFKQKQPHFEEGRDWMRFIRSFELIVGPRKFSSEKKVAELISCLGDKALDMFLAAYKPLRHTTWDHVLELCQEMWSNESMYDRATRELDTPMLISDTIQGYWQEKIKFATIINPLEPVKLAKSKFYSGLPEKIRLAAAGAKEGPAEGLFQVATIAAFNCDWKRDLAAVNAQKRARATFAAEVGGDSSSDDSPPGKRRYDDRGDYLHPRDTHTCYYPDDSPPRCYACGEPHHIADCLRMKRDH